MNWVAGLDPGRSKCGLVLVAIDAEEVLAGHVLAPEAVLPLLKQWQQEGDLTTVVLGDGTGSVDWVRPLQQLVPVQLVNEHGTTLRARRRFWDLWPPRAWRRLLPDGMRLPPTELDAIAALVMVEDHCKIRCRWPGPAPLRIGHGR